MPAARQLEDLEVWQLATELRDAALGALRHSGLREGDDLLDQIGRSARSTPANIAEGFGHFHPREFAKYLRIARASAMETRSHLLEAGRHLPPPELAALLELSRRLLAALAALIRYLEARDARDTQRPPRPRRP